MTTYRITIELDYSIDIVDLKTELKERFQRLLEDGELYDMEDEGDFDTYDVRVEVVEPPKKPPPDLFHEQEKT